MFKNSSIRTRVIIGMVLVALLSLIARAVDFRVTQQSSESFDEIRNQTAPSLVNLSEIDSIGRKMVAEANAYALFQDELLAGGGTDIDPEALEELENERIEFEESIGDFEAVLAQYRSRIEGEPDDQEFAQAMDETVRQLYAVGLELIELKVSGISGEVVLEQQEELEELEGELEGLVREAIALETTQLSDANEELDNSIATAQVIEVLLLVITILILLALGWIIISSVIVPVRKLVTVANAIAEGNLARRAAVDSQDELGALGNTFNQMADQIEKRIAETEAARARAEQSDKVKSAFLAGMSHELRTPLNSIINFTKFVKNGVLGSVNEQQEETLGEVIDSGTHLLALINDILDMSKIESGSLNLFVEDNVNIKAVLESAASTAKSLLGEKPITLTTEIDEELPLVRGDRQRLLQIVLNILSNACKFTENGSITLKAHSRNDELYIAIQDTGPGIPQEDFEAVFEPFKQTQTGIRQGGGTGLGMPISKNLVEAHGGRLRLESTLHQGTTFYVVLPVKSDKLVPLRSVS